jgi:F-type H+-transporting ATPase subunit epsilon
MADGPLQVELVAADRTVWSGQATMVIARTVEGDVGVLKDHAPLLSLLADAVVEIETGDETVVAAVDGGFISVAQNRVSILSERALLADEIDVKAVESELEEARASEDDDAEDRVRRAEVQLRAAEKAS